MKEAKKIPGIVEMYGATYRTVDGENIQILDNDQWCQCIVVAPGIKAELMKRFNQNNTQN